jgi:hypothetical protein
MITKLQKTVLLGTTGLTKPRALHGKHKLTAHSDHPRLQRSEALASEPATATTATTAVDDGSGGADAPSTDNGVTSVAGTPENGGSEPSITLLEVRAQIISLIAAKGRDDRYAALLSQCRTRAAHDLIYRLFGQIADWQLKSGERLRKYRVKSGSTFVGAVERFVGDLLRARADTNGSGRVYHALGRMKFEDDPVTYDLFKRALDGLKALELVGQEAGQTRFRKVEEWGTSVTLPGRGSRFWATAKLLKLAEEHGITKANVRRHFKPGPPHNPLVLRDYATGIGRTRRRGPIIKDYERTEDTKRLAADIRDLNAFLAGCDISGGVHEGYTRNFNLCQWNKGGRLYSVGGGYQQLPEEKRLQMTINGEAVAEIDIKASYLTIYQAPWITP